MHPPDQRDPRFLFPYPAAHSMRLQVLPVLLILSEQAVMGYGYGDEQGGMWDHRSTRKPPPPQLQAAAKSRESETEEIKPQAATRGELDADALPILEKRRAEGPEAEGGGGSSKRRCGSRERSGDGRGADGAGLNGHEGGTRETANDGILVAGSVPQLYVPDCENMEDRLGTQRFGEWTRVRRV
jgi:hypothetical protein